MARLILTHINTLILPEKIGILKFIFENQQSEWVWVITYILFIMNWWQMIYFWHLSNSVTNFVKTIILNGLLKCSVSHYLINQRSHKRFSIVKKRKQNKTTFYFILGFGKRWPNCQIWKGNPNENKLNFDFSDFTQNVGFLPFANLERWQ